MLRFCNLGSGSSGNATVVEAVGQAGTHRLLIDCGLPLRELDVRLAQVGLQTADIDAIFVTHEHGDHIGSATQLARRNTTPIWMSRGTHEGIGAPDLGELLCTAQDGVAITLGALQITPFTVPHDAREPLQVTCMAARRKLGILTDLGHATPHVLEHLANCNALMLEFNHDTAMLAASRYPKFLKARVGGRHGHLSNTDAGAIVRAVSHGELHHIVAAHLSLQNNCPPLAHQAITEALGLWTPEITIANATRVTHWIMV